MVRSGCPGPTLEAMRAAGEVDHVTYSVRTRLLITMLVLMGAVLIVAGATGYLLERLSLERTAVAQLDREAAEFASFARTTLDPATGHPYLSTSSLLQAAIQQRVLGSADGVLGIVGDSVEWTAPIGVNLRLEDHPALVAAVMAHRSDPVTAQGRVSVDGHDFRYLVVPIHSSALGDSGALVRVIDLSVGYHGLDQTYAMYAVAALLVAVVAGVAAWAVMGRLLSPIAELRAAAETIGEDELSRRIPVRGHDDLSALTTTINRMLDRIQALVEAQRRLADDVGHELRTPLTIMRGHLELLDPNSPAEVRATTALVTEEIDRLSRLTDDLLTLASSERADFVVPTEVEVADLTDETFALVRTLAPRPWKLGGLADLRARLDAQRIRQAWLQLADNAVKYSPEGTEIVLGSEQRDDELWLWVRDHGSGISEAERAVVIQRQVRGESALASGLRGRGLGLAIVTTITEAHHGRLDIAAAPGGGSVFSLVLPVTRKTEAS